MNGHLELVPINQDEAKAFIRANHRYHPNPPPGDKFRVAAAVNGEVVGVAMAGRPSAIELNDGWTVEMTRSCTDGYHNANSKLAGAIIRAAFALGYRRVVTYSLKRESGSSLRAAGFIVVAEIRGREWSCPSRPRVDKGGAQLEAKLRWEATA